MLQEHRILYVRGTTEFMAALQSVFRPLFAFRQGLIQVQEIVYFFSQNFHVSLLAKPSDCFLSFKLSASTATAILLFHFYIPKVVFFVIQWNYLWMVQNLKSNTSNFFFFFFFLIAEAQACFPSSLFYYASPIV